VAADLEKSASAFRTISEVADDLAVPQHVLRFWESKFSAVRPMKRGGNRRYYRPEDLQLLRVINHLLYTEGYTIRGVQKRLREEGPRQLVTQYSRIAATEPSGTAQAPRALHEAAPDDGGDDDLILSQPVEESRMDFDPAPMDPAADAEQLLAELNKMRSDIQAVLERTA
jgi:DNA-binding transcriptional MerR regulator